MSPINTTQWSHAGTGLAGLNICRIRLQKRSVLKCIYTMQFTAYIFNGYEYVYMHAWVSIVYTRVALMIISPIFTLILSKILIPGPQDFLLNLLNPGRCRETSIWWSGWKHYISCILRAVSTKNSYNLINSDAMTIIVWSFSQ